MNLPSYSQFFHTIYDEKSPVGRIGRGTHYSVFESVQWLSPSLGRYKSPKVQKFAIIWDEDHDTRIVDVLEIALMRNLLGPVVFAGERKGSLSIVLSPDFDRLTPSEKKSIWQIGKSSLMVDMPLTAGALTGVIFLRQQPVRSSRIPRQKQRPIYSTFVTSGSLGTRSIMSVTPWKTRKRCGSL
ncbi:hypothetical protein NX009_29435 [Klebsiella pneumoniae]|nr:hypothetical protein [Klebsiella pneumoniae]